VNAASLRPRPLGAADIEVSALSLGSCEPDAFAGCHLVPFLSGVPGWRTGERCCQRPRYVSLAWLDHMVLARLVLHEPLL